jgi:glycosyltransferase involved in cell wall biosynthesis
MKPSILIVLPWSPDLPGGVSVVARNLARIWRAEAIPTATVISDWHSRDLKQIDSQTFKLRLAVTSQPTWGNLLKSLVTAPATLWKTWHLLRARAVTSVSFHYPSLDALGVAVLKRLKLYRGNLVLCFHGTDVRHPVNQIETMLWKFVFASASGVTACSKALAKETEHSFELANGCVTPVYNGVDTATFTPGAANNGAGADLPIGDSPYIVSVGSFIQRKGHRYLLDAFAQVASTYPDLRLILVGMDGAERLPLKAMAESLRLADRVQFLVGLSPGQVAHVIARATVCVQPSIAEPFGMAIIEAGACGVCVAASDVGGHAELIEHGKTGLLFPAADSQAIAHALGQLLNDPPGSNKIALDFRAQISNRYSWKVSADAYVAASAH